MAKGSGGTKRFRNSVAEIASRKIRQVVSDISTAGFSRERPFKIGAVDHRMKEYARVNHITLGSNDVYMSSEGIAHAIRDSKKTKGLSVSDSELIKFPLNRNKMDLFYDAKSKNFTYTDGVSKYIVHPNYRIKLSDGKKKVVNFVTATKMADNKEFNMKKYTKL